MSTTENDAYRKLLCGILEVGVADALKGEPRDCAWIYSDDARILCEMADIDYPRFRDAVADKIDDRRQRRRGRR